MIVFISCVPTKNNQQSVVAQSYDNNKYELLNGNWQLSHYSAYMSAEDLDKMPDYDVDKVIYTISSKDYHLQVSRDKSKGKYDHALPAGSYQLWANQSIVNIEGSLYMYSVVENELTLDSNIDPSLGPDGIVYYFKRL